MIPDWLWAVWFVGSIAVFALLEWRAISNGHDSDDALTHAIRRAFRVHTVPGAFVFFAFLAAFGFLLIWLSAHIVRIPV